MKRKDLIKEAIIQKLKALQIDKPGWLYTRTALQQATQNQLGHRISSGEFNDAIKELKKENKIHRMTTYS